MNLNILKPKSNTEITNELNSLTPFEFIYTIESCQKHKNIKQYKIKFKLKFYYFFLIIFRKYMFKLYWPVWSAWFILNTICIIYKIKEGPLFITKYVCFTLFTVIFIFIIINIYLNKKYFKYKLNKLKEKTNAIVELLLNRHLF